MGPEYARAQPAKLKGDRVVGSSSLLRGFSINRKLYRSYNFAFYMA